MLTGRFAILNNIYNKDWCDFRLVNNNQGEPEYFVFTQEVGRHDVNAFSEVKIVHWLDILQQLMWE